MITRTEGRRGKMGKSSSTVAEAVLTLMRSGGTPADVVSECRKMVDVDKGI